MNKSNFFYDNFEQTIISRIKNIMEHKKISQSLLAELTAIPQGTISKILHNKTKMTFSYFAQICNALEIDPSSITSFTQTPFDDITLMYDQIYEATKPSENDIFIYNADRSAFRGYLGDYHLYSYSTKSSETNLLHGIFHIFGSKNGGKCEVALDLFTGLKTDSGKDIIKKYTGEMMISIPMSTCYAVMTNSEIGEMLFIAFHHMFSFNQNIFCRMALGISTSSGENRRPIAQRLLLSRVKLDTNNPLSKDSQFLQGQLRLNSSEIIISKNNFDHLLKSEVVSQKPEIKTFLEKCRQVIDKEEYYTIEESKLRGIKASTSDKIESISLLRNYSAAPKYNKVSTKTDEFTYSYLQHTSINEDIL